MKKKVLSIILVMAMVLTMLTGCGGGKEASSEEAANPNKLTVWAWDKAFNIYAMEEAAKIYKETHPEFELEIAEVGWNDVQTKCVCSKLQSLCSEHFITNRRNGSVIGQL